MRNDSQIKVENEGALLGEVIFNVVVVDHSGSMDREVKIEGVNKVLKKIKQSLCEMEYTGNTRVCIVNFSSDISATPLQEVDRFISNYRPMGGYTVLYDTIVFLKERILELYEKYAVKQGRRLIFNVTILSDGNDEGSSVSQSKARSAIETLESKVPNLGIVIYDLGIDVEETARKLGIERKEVPVTEEGFEKLGDQLSESLVQSSVSGLSISQLAQNGSMSVSSGNASVSDSSALATEKFKEMVDDIETKNIFSLLDDL